MSSGAERTVREENIIFPVRQWRGLREENFSLRLPRDANVPQQVLGVPSRRYGSWGGCDVINILPANRPPRVPS